MPTQYLSFVSAKKRELLMTMLSSLAAVAAVLAALSLAAAAFAPLERVVPRADSLALLLTSLSLWLGPALGFALVRGVGWWRGDLPRSRFVCAARSCVRASV